MAIYPKKKFTFLYIFLCLILTKIISSNIESNQEQLKKININDREIFTKDEIVLKQYNDILLNLSSLKNEFHELLTSNNYVINHLNQINNNKTKINIEQEISFVDLREESDDDYFSNFEISNLYQNFNDFKLNYLDDENRKFESNYSSESLLNSYFSKKDRYDIHNRIYLYSLFWNIEKKKRIFLDHNNTEKNSFFSSTPISFFEIFNYKSVAKNDNGLLQNQMIIIAKNKTLNAYDLYLNLLGTIEFNDEIVCIRTFKNQEDNIIYMLFKIYSTDEKFNKNKKIFALRKIKILVDTPRYYVKNFNSENNKENKEEDHNSEMNKRNHNNKYPEEILYDLEDDFEEYDKVTVRNFKENLGTYTINKHYKQQIDKNKFYFEIDKEIFLTNENLRNFKIHTSKSIKFLILLCGINEKENKIHNSENHEVIYLNDELDIINNFTINSQYESLIEDVKFFYNFAYTKFKDSIKISQIENYQNFIVSCDFNYFLKGYSTDNMEKYYKKYIFTYDQINNYLILLTENLEILIYFPIVKSSNTKAIDSNICNFRKFFKSDDLKKLLGIEFFNIKKLNLNLVKVDIIRSDLIFVFSEYGKLLLINLNKFEENIDDDNLELKVIDIDNLEFYKDSLNLSMLHFEEKTKQQFIISSYSSDLIFCKNTFSNFIILQNYNNPNELMIFEIFNPHSKLVGGDYSFLNFKIPIIFVAMIIIFFYHFFKKKNELNDPSNPEVKKEIFKYLEDEGAFKKRFQEEKENRLNFNNPIKFSKEEKNNNADESLNESDDLEDEIEDEREYKSKIMEFLKNKS